MKPFYDYGGITIYQGHVLDVLKELSPESIQGVITSPPYWGLRDYGLPPQIWDDPGGCEHEWGEMSYQRRSNDNKYPETSEKQLTNVGANKRDIPVEYAFCQLCGAWRGSLGLEPTPELYIQHIVQVGRELWRVGRKDMTFWLNMGDSYNSYKANTGDTPYAGFTGRPSHRDKGYGLESKTLKPKDLCGIPWRVVLALQADGWWLRSDIIWSKPNPMPESVTDRPTRAHEYLFLLTKSAKYFYDADAVKEESIADRWGGHKPMNLNNTKDINGQFKGLTRKRDMIPANRNLRSVWTIATEPTPEAHFATFPEKLVIPCIKAGTSEKGCCPECGAPWVRVVEKESKLMQKTNNPRNVSTDGKTGYSEMPRMSTESKTIGWNSTCKCPVGSVIPCTVLDPFSGSGKTLIVAQKFGRKGIGIELNPEYCKMPMKKLAQNRLF